MTMNRHEPAWRAALNKGWDHALSTLPEEERRALELARKEDRQTVRARAAAAAEAKKKRNRRFFELLLRGHTRGEIAKATGANEVTISNVLSALFPFPHPGRDNRYLAMRLSSANLAIVDELAADHLMDRQRVLELICSAALEQRGFHARRLLRIPGGA
jgi:hypothetical protein